MIQFLKNRIQNLEYSHWGYKYSTLSNTMDTDDIDFTNVRGNVNLSRHNVLTPKEINCQIDEIISFNFNR